MDGGDRGKGQSHLGALTHEKNKVTTVGKHPGAGEGGYAGRKRFAASDLREGGNGGSDQHCRHDRVKGDQFPQACGRTSKNWPGTVGEGGRGGNGRPFESVIGKRKRRANKDGVSR